MKKNKISPKRFLINNLIQFLLAGIIIGMFANFYAIAQTPKPDFFGQAIFRTGITFENTEIGGLSGITYNRERETYYAISDDRSSKAPARFYSIQLNLAQNSFSDNSVIFADVTTLLDETGKPFPALSLDPEAIVFTGNSLFISSEGDVNRQIQPFIKEFSLDGKQIRNLAIPEKFLIEPNRGVRNNLSIESLTITPDKKYLFAATENALFQDGEEATLTTGTPTRIWQYDLNSDRSFGEFLYITEPIAAAPSSANAFSTNGLVELLGLDDNRLLALERSFSVGAGNSIKLFEVSLEGATNIQEIDNLSQGMPGVSPVTKKLLLDLSTLDLVLDNVEGMTFGPNFVDGRRSLVLVSDNNFNPFQVTQFLIFRF